MGTQRETQRKAKQSSPCPDSCCQQQALVPVPTRADAQSRQHSLRWRFQPCPRGCGHTLVGGCQHGVHSRANLVLLLSKSSRNHRIIESFRLEKTFKIIESNHQTNTTMPTKPCPKVPRLPGF